METPLAVVVSEMLPQVDEQRFPFCVSFQLTPLLLTSLATVAVNWAVRPAGTFAEVGETVTEIACTVMVAKTDSFRSATDVAVSVTVMGEAGAE